jgi:hypothetical protein
MRAASKPLTADERITGVMILINVSMHIGRRFDTGSATGADVCAVNEVCHLCFKRIAEDRATVPDPYGYTDS